MVTLITRVQKALQEEFSPREIIVEAVRPGKVDGWIVSKSFEKLSDQERQRKVWRLIETHLTEKDRKRVLGFFTYTPLEKKFIFEENFDSLGNGGKRKASSSKKKTTPARKPVRNVAPQRKPNQRGRA